MKKSSEQQVNVNTDIEIKVLGKSFWGHEVGYKMLSPTPGVILHYINQHNAGIRLEVITMRDEPALTCDPDFTCPLTSGILLRIVAEMNYAEQAKFDITGYLKFFKPFFYNLALYSTLLFYLVLFLMDKNYALWVWVAAQTLPLPYLIIKGNKFKRK